MRISTSPPAAVQGNDLTQGNPHETVKRKTSPLRTFLLMPFVIVLICTKAAPMDMNAITHMCVAWKGADNATRHTSTFTPHAVGAVTPRVAPDDKREKTTEWLNTAPVPKSPVTECILVWEKELVDDPDKDFILDGLKNGFKLIDKGATADPSCTKNYKSAYITNKDETEQQIQNEIQKGRYIISETPPSFQAWAPSPRKKAAYDLSMIYRDPGAGSTNTPQIRQFPTQQSRRLLR